MDQATRSQAEEPSRRTRDKVKEKLKDWLPCTRSPARETLIPTNENNSSDDEWWNMLWSSEDEALTKDIASLLWKRAYELLKFEEPTLLQHFERAFDDRLKEIEQQIEDPDDLHVPWSKARILLTTRMAAEIVDKEHTMAHSSWRKVMNSVGITVSFAYTLSPLLNLHPPAASAWAALEGIICISQKPIKNKEELAEGLAYVVKYLEKHEAMSRALLRRTWNSNHDIAHLRKTMADQSADLLKSFLRFLIKASSRAFASRGWVVSWKDITDQENWIVSDLKNIKEAEDRLATNSGQYLMEGGVTSLMDVGDQIKHWSSSEEGKLVGRFNTSDYSLVLRKLSQPTEGTLQWFKKHNNFQRWLGSDGDSRLVVTAEPGCGKSVPAKHLATDIIPKKQSCATACYYFFQNTSEQRSGTTALCALLHQFFMHKPEVVKMVKSQILRQGEEVSKSFDALQKIWRSAVEHQEANNFWIVIDSLDLCHPEDRISFLETIESQAGSKKSLQGGPNILITARVNPKIERMLFRREPLYKKILLSGEKDQDKDEISAECDLVVRERTQALAESRNWKSGDKHDIQNMLTKKGLGQRTYLWVGIIFQLLEDNTDNRVSKWKALIERLPDNVAGAYEELLKNVKDEEMVRVRRLLELIVVAKRPLSLGEMNVALHIHEKSKDGGEVKEECKIDKTNSDEDFELWIKEQCSSFVTVYSEELDLLHPTAYEWLRKDGSPLNWTGSSSKWRHSIETGYAELTMATSCLDYLCLNENDFKAKSRTQLRLRPEPMRIRTLLRKHCFLDYSTRFWMGHFRAQQSSEAGPKELILQKVVKILNLKSGRNILWYWIKLADIKESADSYDPSQTALMAAISFGLEEVVNTILELQNTNINEQSHRRRTAVHFAVIHGKTELLVKLIAHGANMAIQDEDLRTPLHYAVKQGNAMITKTLVSSQQRGDIDLEDIFGLRPRHLAIPTRTYHSELTGIPKLLGQSANSRFIEAPIHAFQQDMTVPFSGITNLILSLVWGCRWAELHVFAAEDICNLTDARAFYARLVELLKTHVSVIAKAASTLEAGNVSHNFPIVLYFLNRQWTQYMHSARGAFFFFKRYPLFGGCLQDLFKEAKNKTHEEPRKEVLEGDEKEIPEKDENKVLEMDGEKAHEKGKEKIYEVQALFIEIWSSELYKTLRKLLEEGFSHIPEANDDIRGVVRRGQEILEYLRSVQGQTENPEKPPPTW